VRFGGADEMAENEGRRTPVRSRVQVPPPSLRSLPALSSPVVPVVLPLAPPFGPTHDDRSPSTFVCLAASVPAADGRAAVLPRGRGGRRPPLHPQVVPSASCTAPTAPTHIDVASLPGVSHDACHSGTYITCRGPFRPHPSLPVTAQERVWGPHRGLGRRRVRGRRLRHPHLRSPHHRPGGYTLPSPLCSPLAFLSLLSLLFCSCGRRKAT